LRELVDRSWFSRRASSSTFPAVSRERDGRIRFYLRVSPAAMADAWLLSKSPLITAWSVI
jgi:hypothetical protein